MSIKKAVKAVVKKVKKAEPIVCTVCNGKGLIDPHTLCTYCEGSGRA